MVDIKVAPLDAERHPTKIAVFSSVDLPVAWDHVAIKPAVAIDGVVMDMWVSEFVPKGRIFILNKSVSYKAKDEW